MPRIVIRYLTGSRANQADMLPADSGEDLIAGRDPLASIHFDPEQDDLVSRQHLKITRDPENPAIFRLIDLQSRNGTFVNRRRVYGSTFLSHNDCVQLGPSGPEFRFELDPPPAFAMAASAAFGAEAGLPPPTRETFGAYPATREIGGAGPSRPIGRATVERMLDDTFGLLKQESTKGVLVGLLCIAAVLIVGLGTWSYMRAAAIQNEKSRLEAKTKMEQINQEVQKGKEEAARQAAAQIESQHRIDEENKRAQKAAESTLQKILRAQVAEEARQKQILSQAQTPVTAPNPLAPPTFTQLHERVDNMLLERKYPEAATASNQMVQLDPNRYEGYYLGGMSALELGHTTQAKDLLTKAMAKAPLDHQSTIQELLAQAERSK